jgi:hypothetical protein
MSSTSRGIEKWGIEKWGHREVDAPQRGSMQITVKGRGNVSGGRAQRVMSRFKVTSRSTSAFA